MRAAAGFVAEGDRMEIAMHRGPRGISICPWRGLVFLAQDVQGHTVQENQIGYLTQVVGRCTLAAKQQILIEVVDQTIAHLLVSSSRQQDCDHATNKILL